MESAGKARGRGHGTDVPGPSVAGHVGGSPSIPALTFLRCHSECDGDRGPKHRELQWPPASAPREDGVSGALPRDLAEPMCTAVVDEWLVTGRR